MPALAIPLFELLLLLVGIGIALTSRPAAGGLVNWLSKVVRNVPLVGGVLSIDQIVKLDRWITHEIGKATGAVTRRGVKWFGDLVHYQEVVGYWSLYWPVGLLHAVRQLVERHIPRAISARTAPLAKRLDATEAQAKAAAGIAHSTTKVAKGSSATVEVTKIQRVAMPHAKEWEWIHENYKALQHTIAATATSAASVALPHSIAWPVPWGLTIKNLRKRTRRLEALLGAAGAAALVARAIGGVTANCVRKGNIGRVARHICGIDKWLIDLLLLGTVEAFVASDLCAFSDLLIKSTQTVRPALMALVDVDEALIGCHGYTAPNKLTLPPVSLPSLVDAVSLAA